MKYKKSETKAVRLIKSNDKVFLEILTSLIQAMRYSNKELRNVELVYVHTEGELSHANDKEELFKKGI